MQSLHTRLNLSQALQHVVSDTAWLTVMYNHNHNNNRQKGILQQWQHIGVTDLEESVSGISAHPRAPGCSPYYSLYSLHLERKQIKICVTLPTPSMEQFQLTQNWPSFSGMFSTGTFNSRGQTLQRISSVMSPPSLMAILLSVPTSTGVAFRACVMSAIFRFLFGSAPAHTVTVSQKCKGYYHNIIERKKSFTATESQRQTLWNVILNLFPQSCYSPQNTDPRHTQSLNPKCLPVWYIVHYFFRCKSY